MNNLSCNQRGTKVGIGTPWTGNQRLLLLALRCLYYYSRIEKAKKVKGVEKRFGEEPLPTLFKVKDVVVLLL